MVRARRPVAGRGGGDGLQKVEVPEARTRNRSAAVSATLRPAMRWGWLFALVAVALIAAFTALRAQTKAQQAGSGDDAIVLAADNALGDAVRAGDKLAARKLLALQFSFVNADGKIYARKDFLNDLKGVAAAPPSDVEVRSYGLLAIVTGQRKSASNADMFFLDVWARQKGAWRALVSQAVTLAAAAAPAAPAPAADAAPYECKNPCQTIPYRVRSVPEQEVIATFQAIEKAVVARDAVEWAAHIADEFVVYRSARPPAGKTDRITAIERQKEANSAVTVGEVQNMRLAVYGDAGAMVADQVAPDNARPPYRATRLWVKRGGQWLLAVSVQTDIK
jgi:ketosteroid isomerase-like protein